MEAIQAALERIALAFEEQNRINLEWMSIQTSQHEVVEAINEKRYQESMALEREYLALRTNDSDLYERWIIIQEQMIQQAHAEFAAHLKAIAEAPTDGE